MNFHKKCIQFLIGKMICLKDKLNKFQFHSFRFSLQWLRKRSHSEAIFNLVRFSNIQRRPPVRIEVSAFQSNARHGSSIDGLQEEQHCGQPEVALARAQPNEGIATPGSQNKGQALSFATPKLHWRNDRGFKKAEKPVILSSSQLCWAWIILKASLDSGGYRKAKSFQRNDSYEYEWTTIEI